MLVFIHYFYEKVIIVQIIETNLIVFIANIVLYSIYKPYYFFHFLSMYLYMEG